MNWLKNIIYKTKLHINNDKYMYPSKFHKFTSNNGYDVCILNITNDKLQWAKEFIDQTRELNSRDPGFCYTCENTDTNIIWYFGYLDMKICDKVERIGKHINTRYTKTGVETESKIGIINTHGCPCPCPFKGV